MSESQSFKRLNERNIALIQEDESVSLYDSGEESVMPKVVCAGRGALSVVWKR